ncbi:MAG TPA: alpha amylase N-terminal ig-like domain-containing protein [Ktedonobacteraceae bacterium]|nr:alpha amylase N-terminal ig-like domain-containing protein [Ktedonobacteraceae bacterium]
MLNFNWTDSVHHDGSPRYVRDTSNSPGTTVTLRLRTGLDAPIERIFVRTNPDGEQRFTPMHQVAADSACQWWETSLQLRMLRNNYRFYLLTSEGSWWLTAGGMLRYTPTDASDFKILTHYQAPIWVHDAVFYPKSTPRSFLP